MMLRQIITDSADPIPGVEKLVAHNLGFKPDFVHITPKQNAIVYMSLSSSTQVGIKSDTANAAFDIKCVIDHSLIK